MATISSDTSYSQITHLKVAVAAGETSQPVAVAADLAVVVVFPGSGGTMDVQASWSLPSEVASGSARWIDWDAGTVSAQASQIVQKATAIRFIAATAAGIGEVAR